MILERKSKVSSFFSTCKCKGGFSGEKKTESPALGHSVAPYVKMVKQGLAQLVIARPSVREVSPKIDSNFYLKYLFLLFSPFFVNNRKTEK